MHYTWFTVYVVYCYYIVACLLYAYNLSLATCLFSVDYTCSMDGEGVNATSGSPVLGGALWCGYLCNVLGIYGDATVESTDCKSCASMLAYTGIYKPSQYDYGPSISHTDCHSSCKSCLRGNDSTACTSCSDDSLEVVGDPAGPCQPPGKNGSYSCSVPHTEL